MRTLLSSAKYRDLVRLYVEEIKLKINTIAKNNVNSGKTSWYFEIKPTKVKRYKVAKTIAGTAMTLSIEKTIVWMIVLTDLVQDLSILSFNWKNVSLSSCFIAYFPACVVVSPIVLK